MDSKVVIGDRLIDGTGSELIENAVIVIENERIIEIGRKDEVSIPPDAQIIEGKTVMPGMIEAHAHLFGTLSMNPHDWLLDPIGLRAIRSSEEARRLLNAGYTSIRDLCGATILYLKHAINEGSVPGPRVYAAGRCISQTAGHADAHDIPMTWLIEHGWFGIMADGPDECRKAARINLRDGADLLKVMTTGGVMSEKDHPMWPQLTVEEVQAVVEEANKVNTIVASHAQSPIGIQIAIEAGVKTIEHGIFLDEDTIEMMLKKDVILVPTLSVLSQIALIGDQHGVPEYGIRKAKEMSEIHLKSIQKAVAAGVTIGAGADFLGPAMCRHGDNAMELGFLVEAGMTPMEAIVAGTRNSGLALGPRGQDLGTIEEGKFADLLVIDGDPLADISVLQETARIKVVMKGGDVVVRKT
ncbi:MAG: amidohydrolase family protein [Candidatus Heimdallarchaeota archaeon]